MKSTTVKLAEGDKPRVWFVTSIEDKGRIQFRLLPGQFVPVTPAHDEYEEGNTSLIVNASKEKRGAYPLGSVFALDNITKDMSFYRATDARVACVSEYDADATEQDIEAWRRFKASMPTYSPVEEEPAPRRGKAEEVKGPGITLLARLKTSSSLRPPTIEDDGYYVDPELWYLLCRNVKKNVHTLLAGPTGGGKTVLTALLAKSFGRKFYSYNMGAMQDPVAGLLGTNALVLQEGKTVSVFKPALFARQIAEEGVLFNWDELSRMPWGASNILFPVIDEEQRYLPLYYAQTEGSDTLPLGTGSVVFATANLGAEYVNTVPVDRALKDRFMIIDVGYLPVEEEVKLLKKLYKLSHADASNIVGIADTVRRGYQNGNLSAGISPRYTKEAAALVRDGFTVNFAVKRVFLPLFEGTDTQGDRSTVLTAISSR